jgi:hypothetical protein
MTKQEMVFLLEKEVKGLSTVLDLVDYQNACDDAVRETGYILPNTVNAQIYWLKFRAKRHLFFYLLSESAHKFKVKQYSLNQRFEHYRDTIEYMDKVWNDYLLSEQALIDELAGVDSVGLFGTKIDAGFQYDEVGRDTTYSEDNQVEFHPDESDSES